MVVLIAYAVPSLGLLASLCLPLVTHRFRHHLWPEASTARSIGWSVLAWAGLWAPALTDLFTPAFRAAGVDVSTTWLVIPLCAPTGLGAVVVPAVASAVTCGAGLLCALATRRRWVWVVAAWLAPWAHQLVYSRLPHEFFC